MGGAEVGDSDAGQPKPAEHQRDAVEAGHVPALERVLPVALFNVCAVLLLVLEVHLGQVGEQAHRLVVVERAQDALREFYLLTIILLIINS